MARVFLPIWAATTFAGALRLLLARPALIGAIVGIHATTPRPRSSVGSPSAKGSDSCTSTTAALLVGATLAPVLVAAFLPRAV